MEIKQVIRRQYLVTFDEEEAQNIWAFLDCLQESDYEAPFKRSRLTNPAQQASIMKAMSNLRQALTAVPAARSDSGTRHL